MSCGGINKQTDGQTDLPKLIVAFRNFVNAPKNALIKFENIRWEKKTRWFTRTRDLSTKITFESVVTSYMLLKSQLCLHSFWYLRLNFGIYPNLLKTQLQFPKFYWRFCSSTEITKPDPYPVGRYDSSTSVSILRCSENKMRWKITQISVQHV